MIQNSRDASPRSPRLSIVIPALDEEAALGPLMASLEAQAAGPPLEVILADGGSRDKTIARFRDLTGGRAGRDSAAQAMGAGSWAARGWEARLVACPSAGRATQMNAGARAARGEALLFLHADTRLPPGATAAIASVLADPRVVGGGFRHRFSEPGLLLRLISAYATARSLLRGIHYGDQAIFLRRSVFETLGGFTEVELFEDLRLSRALRRRGRVVTLPLAAETSARRLRAGGVGRTALKFAWLKIRHALGADPARLKTGYPDVR
ncbi:MAG TPA: TIGR04283 family arsenosugar biosynthesis glycosyltransferase [Candidatus Polarisedimenticolia bacterium]|nr:TIGR04283 family arsenosugar biosynthesis glycosyltransferase [Candidatus Polarisedimenticolia bacterium]